MGQSVSAVEARQKFGKMLNRVALRREEIIIERAGKKIPAFHQLKMKNRIHRASSIFEKLLGWERRSGKKWMLMITCEGNGNHGSSD